MEYTIRSDMLPVRIHIGICLLKTVNFMANLEWCLQSAMVIIAIIREIVSITLNKSKQGMKERNTMQPITVF